ncbi:MAG: YgaP family membrane protein [Gammaproteobacteria bacterium]
MKGLSKLMATPFGRIIRILGGAALIAWGLAGVGGSNGILIAVVGVLPILTGAFNICLIGPLFGAPLSGSRASAVQD